MRPQRYLGALLLHPCYWQIKDTPFLKGSFLPAIFFHKGSHIFSLLAVKFYDHGGKKIKIITIGHKVVGFSDAVLQAGELYSYSKAFYLYEELHRFSCKLFPWGLGGWMGLFWEGEV